MAAFDDDRIIAVTWDARVIVLNVRTGVFELVQDLQLPPELTGRLYATQVMAYSNGRLTVASPAGGVLADYRITGHTQGVGFKVALERVSETPNVVAAFATPTATWIVKSNEVLRRTY